MGALWEAPHPASHPLCEEACVFYWRKPLHRFNRISYSSAAQRNPIRGEKSPRELGVTSRFDPSTEERFETRMLISASPRLPPRTTRCKLELVAGPTGFRTLSRE